MCQQSDGRTKSGILNCCGMPTYFFRLSTVPTAPDEGEELPNLKAAIALAREIVRDISKNQHPSYVRRKAIVVTDKSGTEVFKIPLRR